MIAAPVRPFEVAVVCGLLGIVSGCRSTEPVEEAAEARDEAPPVVETRWTARTELFVEYPVLVEGVTSRFAIHFTDLATFEPVREGRARVRLVDDAGAAQAFDATAPGRPGIFGIDVVPARAGRMRLELVLDSPAVTDRHDLGPVTVLTPPEAATIRPGADEDDGGGIAFLKEQQWALDFATAPADRRRVADSLRIAGEIEPRTGGRAEVTMPVDGRLAGNLPPRPVGTPVSRGDVLAEMIPHSAHADDRPALDLEVAEARNARELAHAERARVERLVTAGALPERRRLEARVAAATADARVTAAEAHLAQLDATRTGSDDGGPEIRFVLRAPISGVVAASTATPGASVEAGTPLFRLVAVDRVHVVGSLPEADLARVDELVGAELDVPGFAAPIPLDRLVSVGRVVDPGPRTIPIIYELEAPDRRLAIGQAVSLRVFVAGAVDAVTVPERAVVDDAGQAVVFVQVGGERFERRAVRLGNREGGMVQVAGDLAAGDRVVVRGAALIRLAALSPQVPAHGHTH